MQKRVLITGAGVVSAIGFGQEQSLEALRQGLSGVERVRFLPTEHTEFPVGEVKLSNEMLCRQLNIPYTKRESRTELMGMLALKEALLQARLIDEAGTPAVQGLALLGGTTVAGMDRTEAFYPDRLDADILNRHDCGASTNAIADYFGCFDLATTVSTACSAALNAIIMGARMIKSGLRDIVVVGGSESLSRFHLNGFKSLMILGLSTPHEPVLIWVRALLSSCWRAKIARCDATPTSLVNCWARAMPAMLSIRRPRPTMAKERS